MLGGQSASCNVIDRQRIRARDRATDAKHRFAHIAQRIKFALGQLHRNSKHRINTFARQQLSEHCIARATGAVQVIERQVITRINQVALNLVEHSRKEPAIDKRHHHADVSRAASHQRISRGRRNVSQLVSELLNQIFGLLRNVRVVAQRTRNGGRRNSGSACNINNANHAKTLYFHKYCKSFTSYPSKLGCARALKAQRQSPSIPGSATRLAPALKNQVI